jgi:hypothetical protein
MRILFFDTDSHRWHPARPQPKRDTHTKAQRHREDYYDNVLRNFVAWWLGVRTHSLWGMDFASSPCCYCVDAGLRTPSPSASRIALYIPSPLRYDKRIASDRRNPEQALVRGLAVRPGRECEMRRWDPRFLVTPDSFRFSPSPIFPRFPFASPLGPPYNSMS